jgi:tRNA threonylcarbamoyladenosine biosynthesis protein TsaB
MVYESRMIVLAATTSTRRGGVAVVRSTSGAPETLALVEYDAADDHAEKLFRTLDQATHEAGIEKSNIERIACDVGPGSFTGTRAGTAALYAIAWSLKVSTVGIGSLEAMAFVAQKELGNETVLTLLDARRSEIFGAVYGTDRVLVEPFHRARADEAYLLELVCAHGALVVGEIASSFPALAELVRPVASLPSAVAIAELALLRKPDDSALLPVYVRAPDAKTIEERARGGSVA